MEREKEGSLQKRPELVPERLMRGGLIVGVEQGIQGSLMSVTGAAIERITRERTEVSPNLRLPERPVYFLDPNTRRLIMISNRENRGENKTPDKYGLFAEIVELDEEGKPHYRLSTSDIILPNDNYQLVAVGPNNYGFPPSHIDVVEEEEEGKKKFVPWNLWLGQLQIWMNEVKIDPNEDFETFVKRFSELQKSSEFIAKKKIDKIFPASFQGVNEKTIPVNMIITDKEDTDSLLFEVSREAGFYPARFHVENLNNFYHELLVGHPDEDIAEREQFSINRFAKRDNNPFFLYDLALITVDKDASINEARLRDDLMATERISLKFQEHNSIFAVVSVNSNDQFPSEARKRLHGYYYSPYDKDRYRGLLNKLKADLLLTMFLRGGAPIVK